MRISDWSSDVCSSDLRRPDPHRSRRLPGRLGRLSGRDGAAAPLGPEGRAMSATAAGPTAYPFRGHRTVAEIWAAARGEPRPPAEPFPFRNHRTVAEVDAAAAPTGGNVLPLSSLT